MPVRQPVPISDRASSSRPDAASCWSAVPARRASSRSARAASCLSAPRSTRATGVLTLTSALPSGKTQTGSFGGGRFVIRQTRTGMVDLYLRGKACDRRGARSAGAVASASRSRGGRRLWGRDHGGRFRTHGRNSHATVRGTRWVVGDSCAGTLTRVVRGSVVVRDEVRRKRVVLHAGERYLARTRR